MKTATIRARIEPELKDNVEHILISLGLSTTEAITMFYNSMFQFLAITGLEGTWILLQ